MEYVDGVNLRRHLSERGSLSVDEALRVAEQVLDALLPRYVRSRIYSCLLQAAASELASRQRAMHTATENAEDLIRMYTRLANQARQAEITQEISEIVSGADALAS
jgi:F-type H+-transporting ATPase subunit gamma